LAVLLMRREWDGKAPCAGKRFTAAPPFSHHAAQGLDNGCRAGRQSTWKSACAEVHPDRIQDPGALVWRQLLQDIQERVQLFEVRTVRDDWSIRRGRTISCAAPSTPGSGGASTLPGGHTQPLRRLLAAVFLWRRRLDCAALLVAASQKIRHIRQAKRLGSELRLTIRLGIVELCSRTYSRTFYSKPYPINRIVLNPGPRAL
jgi:hypothetical protein